MVEHEDCEEVKGLREEGKPAVFAIIVANSATGVDRKGAGIFFRDYHNYLNASSIF